jgi:hypothetical protein
MLKELVKDKYIPIYNKGFNQTQLKGYHQIFKIDAKEE